MKKILAGAAALLGTAVSAQAADMAVKAPYLKAPVAMVYDWTGFYIGVNAGVGLGRDYTRLAIPAGPSFEASYLSPQGGLGGAQIGYNWQVPNSFFGALVFGVEADIQGTGMRDSYTCLLTCTVVGPGAVATQFNQTLDWFGTVRGRVGIATGPVLSYVTAGYAYGNVKTTLTETVGPAVGVFSTSQNKGGYVIGSGLEASLGGNWTGKIEYLYVNLGDRLNLFTLNGAPQALSTDIRENIFRVGLNYRINGRGNYVTPPPANWAGFYLGGNFGGGTARDRTALNVGGVAGFTELFNLSPDGFNGGIQAGYNWQASNWVFGLEADIQGSSQRDNRACVLTCNPPGTFAAYDATLPWFGTARGRVGYSVGSTLFYATGGYAYGNIKTKIAANIGTGPVSAEISNTKGGWTVGGGIETPFTFLVGVLGNNWTSKTEYLYVDLGTSTGSFAAPGIIGGPAGAVLTNSTQVHEHIFRSGLNYHFNSPVVAKY